MESKKLKDPGVLKPKKFKEQGQAQKSSARFVWNKPLHGWEIEGLDFLAAAKYWIQPLPGNVSSTQGSLKPYIAKKSRGWIS